MPKGIYLRKKDVGYPYTQLRKPKVITQKDKNFANEFLKTGNATQAALATREIGRNGGKPENAAKHAAVYGCRLLQKPTVIEYINSFAQDAVTRIERMSRTARNESVRLLANKDILDRAGYKPTENTNLNLIVPRPLLSEIKDQPQLESGELTEIEPPKNEDNDSDS